jgi:hypothetical protein
MPWVPAFAHCCPETVGASRVKSASALRNAADGALRDLNFIVIPAKAGTQGIQKRAAGASGAELRTRCLRRSVPS